MSHSCEHHSKVQKTSDFLEKPPKSFIGRFLYNLGKKDYEKELHNKTHKGKCC